ncbi:uncharacterized protein MONOS_11443 [Monocercomonoides exilis]|uniref:uncharacterized protein n=1 Tax=Monocercomonoides exilis TaxID=2049356 RepID=UPI00355A3341|nr:hypothetical protein MONOS_11443 [Monocercomonoides exilis]|eukprot:MONOS_11443.1-p1 / transcript=MONOS_11443.1 / gene=MONOS_11443 / organism=Monocercomonoides_exilis_PA203 / gene_product=unspecified product / transcript_product=unspecified product / location=Mono_scaffold00574:37949-39156(+) / protein_length=261 / sequence_SO=supercontig / SO=protein_coding / is_pseudo=false
MIFEEKKKEEEMNEKFLTDLCECFALLDEGFITFELHFICVPCLLKAASDKEETEEVQKDVEMALLALCCIEENQGIGEEQFLNEIKEIIRHHQKHRNLTQLAYQSAWQFMMDRFFRDTKLEEVLNELQFVRETAKELDALMKCVDWKKEKGEKRRKDTKEELIVLRWLQKFEYFFRMRELWDEEYVGLLSSFVGLFRASRDNYRGISKLCIESLDFSASNRAVKVEDLLKGGTIDAVLQVILRPILDDEITFENCSVTA